jgi:hypothetical protein
MRCVASIANWSEESSGMKMRAGGGAQVPANPAGFHFSDGLSSSSA